MTQYLKVEKEQIKIEVTIPGQILIGKFVKDKGIRFTDYFNRDKTKQGFVVLSDVMIIDSSNKESAKRRKFLAVNVEYIITATEITEELGNPV